VPTLPRPFTAEDIEPDGSVAGTTALAYAASRDGELIGRVHLFRVVGWLTNGGDLHEIIGRRLNEVEAS
jgi:hypothetical protein